MARRTETIVTIIDDLDGTEIEEGNSESVKFALDGSAYEIDLSKENATALRDALEPYVKAARPAVAQRGGGGQSRNTKDELAAARQWLRANGHQVSDRGRIAGNLMDLYRSGR